MPELTKERTELESTAGWHYQAGCVAPHIWLAAVRRCPMPPSYSAAACRRAGEPSRPISASQGPGKRPLPVFSRVKML